MAWSFIPFRRAGYIIRARGLTGVASNLISKSRILLICGPQLDRECQPPGGRQHAELSALSMCSHVMLPECQKIIRVLRDKMQAGRLDAFLDKVMEGKENRQKLENFLSDRRGASRRRYPFGLCTLKYSLR